MQQAARALSTKQVTTIRAADVRAGRATRRSPRADVYLAWVVVALILVEAVAQVAMVAGLLPRGWRPW